jgi:hypothetical protein
MISCVYRVFPNHLPKSLEGGKEKKKKKKTSLAGSRVLPIKICEK